VAYAKIEKLDLFDMNLVTSHKLPIDHLPSPLDLNIANWARLNPQFRHLYFDDTQMQDWISDYLPKKLVSAFSLLNTGAGKADFFRIAFINSNGGIWHDADLPAFDLLEQRKDLLEVFSNNELVLVQNRHGGFRYTLIGAQRSCLLLSEFLDYLADLIFDEHSSPSNIKTIELTGPIAFIKFCNSVKGLTIKPESQFSIHNRKMLCIKDIVPKKESQDCENTIPDYRRCLDEMGVEYHYNATAIIVE
jgi:hypothetical protein